MTDYIQQFYVLVITNTCPKFNAGFPVAKEAQEEGTVAPVYAICSVSDYRSLQWRHKGNDSVSNHQPHDCSLNRLSRRRSKETSKLRVTDLCGGIPRTNGQLRWKCFHLITSSCGLMILLDRSVPFVDLYPLGAVKATG